MWDFRGKIRNLSFLKYLNFGVKNNILGCKYSTFWWFSTKNSIIEQISNVNDVINSRVSTEMSLKSQFVEKAKNNNTP